MALVFRRIDRVIVHREQARSHRFGVAHTSTVQPRHLWLACRIAAPQRRRPPGHHNTLYHSRVRVAGLFARRGVLRLQVTVLIEQPGVHDLPHHGTGNATTGLAVFDHHLDDDLWMLGRREADEQGVIAVTFQGFRAVVALALLDRHHLRSATLAGDAVLRARRLPPGQSRARRA